MTADQPRRRRRSGAPPGGTVIGDHATVIVGGNGVVGGGNTVSGHSEPAAARGKAGKAVVGAATVVGTVIAAMVECLKRRELPGGLHLCDALIDLSDLEIPDAKIAVEGPRTAARAP